MQNLTVEQLKGIIATMDFEKIESEIESFGYRNASKYGDWEFDMQAISEARKVDGTEWYEDTFDDRKYCGEIYTRVPKYPNATFVVVSIKHIHRHIGREAYENLICFTDLPLNEEYEKAKNKKKKCTCCKQEFIVGNLTDMSLNGKKYSLCSACFRVKIQEHIEKRTKQLAKRSGRK